MKKVVKVEKEISRPNLIIVDYRRWMNWEEVLENPFQFSQLVFFFSFFLPLITRKESVEDMKRLLVDSPQKKVENLHDLVLRHLQ